MSFPSKRILLLGKNGQLGRSFQKISKHYPNFELTAVGHQEFDLTDASIIKSFFLNAPRFDIIINAAAYTAVDQAELAPHDATQVNHLAIADLAEIAKIHDSFLVHFSTDYVFDGDSASPYLETSRPSPINQYGLSKFHGEQALLASGCAGLIIRTSWLFSEFGHNFVKSIQSQATLKHCISVVSDQYGSPTYAPDLAHTVLNFLTSQPLQGCDLFHYTNEGSCSWYEFAHRIITLSQISCRLEAIGTQEYSSKVQRPRSSILDTTKIKQRLHLTIPTWQNALQRCLTEL